MDARNYALLENHLRYNFFPAVPQAIKYCVEAIEAVENDEYDKMIGDHTALAWVEDFALDSFIRNPNFWGLDPVERE